MEISDGGNSQKGEEITKEIKQEQDKKKKDKK